MQGARSGPGGLGSRPRERIAGRSRANRGGWAPTTPKVGSDLTAAAPACSRSVPCPLADADSESSTRSRLDAGLRPFDSVVTRDNLPWNVPRLRSRLSASPKPESNSVLCGKDAQLGGSHSLTLVNLSSYSKLIKRSVAVAGDRILQARSWMKSSVAICRLHVSSIRRVSQFIGLIARGRGEGGGLRYPEKAFVSGSFPSSHDHSINGSHKRLIIRYSISRDGRIENRSDLSIHKRSPPDPAAILARTSPEECGVLHGS